MVEETLAAIFRESLRNFSSRPALRYKKNKEWREISYAALAQRVQDYAHGIWSFGLQKGDRVALFAKNSPEWAVADWGHVTQGFVTVPIYDTLTADKAAYIIKDSGAKVVVVQGADHLDKIRSVRKQLPDLRHVVIIEEMFEKALEEGEHLFEDVLKLGEAWGKKRPQAYTNARDAVRPEDLASIVYTSGTTGEPKGVMLRQQNFASNVITCRAAFPIAAGDVCLSFLPLSHVFERMAGHFTMVHAGATIAYAESIEKVPENLVEVRPHIMMSVPRLFEKLYARVHEKIRAESFLKRYFFNWAVKVGKQRAQERFYLKVTNPSTERKFKRAERLVFSKIHQRTGGRVKFFVSGGAALSQEIEEFFMAVNLPILQGYGLTETSPVVAFNNFEHLRFGSVGKPIPGAEIRIADDGEILVKGPMVMKGYWNKPEATKEAFTADGFFKTGDVGVFDEDGFLKVTDRKKELIVMSTGKKVAPQPIENELKTKPGIAHAVLIGNGKQYITAIISPDFEALKRYAEHHGIKTSDSQDLLTKDQILKLFEKSVGEINQSLSRYEQIKRYKIIPSEFTQASGELTPTMKVKRRVVDEKYKGEIQELYKEDHQPAP